MEDSLYAAAINDLKQAGAEIVEFVPEEINLPNFTRLLNLDMKKDLPQYFQQYGGEVGVASVEDVVKFNEQDSLQRAPYGQELFLGILADSATEEEFAAIKDTLSKNGKRFFDVPMERHNLDAVLSINNYHAGYAAVAFYPALTVPMGYTENNAPKGLTIIVKPYQEDQLYKYAYGYEQASQKRISPENYTD
jgi:amidase